MRIVSELDTGRLAAPKAYAPAWGIDVGALGGRLRSCAGWECRPACAFFFPGAGGHRRHPAELRSNNTRKKDGVWQKRKAPAAEP